MSDARTALAAEVERLVSAGRPFAARRLLAGVGADRPPIVRHFARRRLAELARDLAPRPGRAWFPVVGAHTAGLVRVDVVPAEDLPDRGSALRDPLDAAAARGAALAGADGRRLVAQLWPMGARIRLEGTSFELAVALAAWSRISEVALPPDVVFSGCLTADGVAAPEHLLEKRRVVTEELGREARLVSGPTAAPGVQYASNLPEIIHNLLHLGGHTPPLDEQRAALRRAVEDRDWRRAAERAASILADAQLARLTPDDAFAVAAHHAQALAHLGRHDEALTALQAALDRAGEDVPQATWSWAEAVVGVALIDAGRAAEAEARLTAALQAPAERGELARFGRARLWGTLARARSAQRHHPEAIQAGRQALTLTRASERARNLGDLALWHLRAGDGAGAEDHLIEARAALADAHAVSPREAQATAAYLDLYAARGRAERGESVVAAALGLAEHPDLAIRLGATELLVRQGDERTLAELDARADLAPGQPVSVVTRYRARIELARATPDLARVAAWVGHPVADPAALARHLAVALPY